MPVLDSDRGSASPSSSVCEELMLCLRSGFSCSSASESLKSESEAESLDFRVSIADLIAFDASSREFRGRKATSVMT